MPKKFDLLVLSFLLVLMNLWYLLMPYGVAWDTSYRFEVFYFFYNHYFFEGNLPQWMPNYSFGIPASWHVLSISPLSWIFMLTGGLFKITSVLVLYKCLLLLEHQVVLLGMYLLCRELFIHRGTVFITCLGAVAALLSYEQIYFDFYFYYLFPLLMYFVIRFIREEKLIFFWLAAMTFMAWMVGNALYYVFIWLPLLFIIVSYLIIREKKTAVFHCFTKKWPWQGMVIAIILAAVVLSLAVLLKDVSRHLELTTRCAGGGNTLKTFMEYTNPGLLKEYFGRFVEGGYSGTYIGLLPVFIFIWGIWRFRSASNYYRAFLFATLVLFWFSLGGLGSAALYHVPGMSYYRHLGYVHGLLKILILICAGFALDELWSSKTARIVWAVLFGLLVLVFIADILDIGRSWVLGTIAGHILWQEWLGNAEAGSLTFRLGLYIFLLLLLLTVIWFRHVNKSRALTNSDVVKFSIILFFCLDVFSFQYASFQNIAAKASPYPREFLDALKVHQEEFRDTRTQTPPDSRAMDVMIALNGGIKYTTVYSVAQFASCSPDQREDLVPKNIKTLLGHKQDQWPELKKILGCGHALKLRLEPSLADDPGADGKLSAPALVQGEINVKKFSANVLEIDVDAPAQGAWLVYADSFHPGWKAEVNGEAQPLRSAYSSLKAVLVKGHAKVRMSFNNGPASAAIYLTALFGILAGVGFIWLYFYTFVQEIKAGRHVKA